LVEETASAFITQDPAALKVTIPLEIEQIAALALSIVTDGVIEVVTPVKE
jgi:hypothetical protein